MKLNLRVIFMGIAVALSSIASPYLIGMAINSYVVHGEIEKLTIIFACLLIMTNPCLRVISSIYVKKISSLTRKSLKQSLIKKLITDANPVSHTYGEIIDLVDGDVEGAIYLYHSIYLDVAQNLSIMLLSLYMIFNYNPTMLIAPLVAMLYSILLHLFSRKVPSEAYASYVDRNTDLISGIGESLAKKARPSFDFHRAQCAHVRTLSLFAHGKISTLEFLSGLSYLIGIMLLFKIGSDAIIGGTLSIGDFVSAAIYIERVLVPTTALIGIYYATSEALYRRARVKKSLLGDFHD